MTKCKKEIPLRILNMTYSSALLKSNMCDYRMFHIYAIQDSIPDETFNSG